MKLDKLLLSTIVMCMLARCGAMPQLETGAEGIPIAMSMAFFGFLNNVGVVTLEVLRKKRKDLLLERHPDKNGGDHRHRRKLAQLEKHYQNLEPQARDKSTHEKKQRAAKNEAMNRAAGSVWYLRCEGDETCKECEAKTIGQMDHCKGCYTRKQSHAPDCILQKEFWLWSKAEQAQWWQSYVHEGKEAADKERLGLLAAEAARKDMGRGPRGPWAQEPKGLGF